jgi:DNA-binding NarL/FixJ family response regulator
MKPIRVLLADDHTLVRAGFRRLIQDLAKIEVVAEAENGREALQLVQEHQPDMILLDIAMPGLNGLEVAARVREQFPQVRVLMLSMYLNEEYVWQALRAGASGYLLKDSADSELEIAIRAVAQGETYLSPPVSKQVISDYMTRADSEPHSLSRLTPRQREVLQLIAEGHSTKEIAFLLKVSVKTVETHRTELMERLSIYDVAGLVRYAIRVGLVSADN